jgi:hypothetical protein
MYARKRLLSASDIWEKVTVRDTAQENVMNAHEETHLFLVVVNQPKNITAISTRQTII